MLARALMSNKVKPNDDFRSNAQQQSDAKAQQAVAKGSAVLTIERERSHLPESQIQVGSTSSSWRITRLMRTTFDVLLMLRVMFSSIPRTIKRGIGGLLNPILACLIHFAMAHPKLKARALTLLFRYPTLEVWLYRFAVTRGIVTGGITMRISSDPSKLTPSALIIYADLKSAIERHNKGD
jgi:hypothetical protein